MIRLFAALAVPGDIAAGLARHQTGLLGASWRKAESLHVTLRFFGEIDEARAEDLDAALCVIRGEPLDMQISAVGAFGEGQDIHAVWAGVEISAPLSRLSSACERAARRAGLKAQPRAWKPHITLAYLHRADPASVAAWIQTHNLLKSPPFCLDSFGLYSSWSGHGGSSYRLERSYRLAAGT